MVTTIFPRGTARGGGRPPAGCLLQRQHSLDVDLGDAGCGLLGQGAGDLAGRGSHAAAGRADRGQGVLVWCTGAGGDPAALAHRGQRHLLGGEPGKADQGVDPFRVLARTWPEAGPAVSSTTRSAPSDRNRSASWFVPVMTTVAPRAASSTWSRPRQKQR